MSEDPCSREASPPAPPREAGASVALCNGTPGFRFDDPYWDDVFDSYHSPTLRICRCC